MKKILSALTAAPLVLMFVKPYLPDDIWSVAVVIASAAMVYAAFNGGEDARSVCSVSALFVTLMGLSEFYQHFHGKPADLTNGMLLATTGIGYILLLIPPKTK